jgi:hypothetical protein
VVVAQLSLPYRIALIAMLAVGALWFTVLKPTPASPEPATTAPGATGLANGVAAARGAAATSDASAAAKQQATGGAEPGSMTAGAAGAHAAATGAKAPPAGAASAGKTAAKKAKPTAATAADRSAPLLRDLDRGRAVVLLFYSARGLDDRAVRRAVADAERRGGRVVVKAVPVGRLGRYQAITRGAQVLQAPTTLVIAPGRTAKPVVGFTTTARVVSVRSTTTAEVDQAVADALAGASARK